MFPHFFLQFRSRTSEMFLLEISSFWQKSMEPKWVFGFVFWQKSMGVKGLFGYDVFTRKGTREMGNCPLCISQKRNTPQCAFMTEKRRRRRMQEWFFFWIKLGFGCVLMQNRIGNGRVFECIFFVLKMRFRINKKVILIKFLGSITCDTEEIVCVLSV